MTKKYEKRKQERSTFSVFHHNLCIDARPKIDSYIKDRNSASEVPSNNENSLIWCTKFYAGSAAPTNESAADK